MTLAAEIDDAKRDVVTDRLSVSINELVSLYQEGEITINPSFQRLFRWEVQQQADLIESILIGIPLPPIFVYETDKAQWELIDGLQRCSTILKFIGVLKKPGLTELEPPTALKATKYLKSLNNCVWERSAAVEGVPTNLQWELGSGPINQLDATRLG